VGYHRLPDWGSPSGPSSEAEPFDLAVGVAGNAAVAVAIAIEGSREFAGVEGTARVVDSAVRNP
jgi:hypothetical protein